MRGLRLGVRKLTEEHHTTVVCARLAQKAVPLAVYNGTTGANQVLSHSCLLFTSVVTQ